MFGATGWIVKFGLWDILGFSNFDLRTYGYSFGFPVASLSPILVVFFVWSCTGVTSSFK